MTRSRGNWPVWRCAIVGLSTVAVALSLYLSWHQLTGEGLVGCGGGSSCDALLSSRWSAIAGIVPVSGLAVGTYLSILVASFFIAPSTPTPVRSLAWGAMLLLSGAAAGSAVWFTIVQLWLVGSFCPYCMVTHIIGVLLAGLIAWKSPADSSRPTGRKSAIALSLAGAALSGVLAASQIAFAPPSVAASGAVDEDSSAIDSRAVPLIGSPNAPNVVSLLFDYQCPHCQKLHFMLEEAVRHFGGKLAFAVCPAPLNSQCNPYVPREVEQFKDSCELAKVALTVWVASPESFPDFQRWMFSYDSGDRWSPRSLEAAETKAVELVGKERFDAARVDPSVERHMKESLRIYGAAGGKAIPVLVFGPRWVNPNPQDADDLVSILHDDLGIPLP